MRLPTVCQQIKRSIDLVRHIGQFEDLIPRNNNQFTGHHNHPDSKGGRCLSVNGDQGVWYCFHCRGGGSILDYEMVRLKTDLPSAISSLIGEYQLDQLTGLDEEEIAEWKDRWEEKKQLQQVISTAFEYYHRQLRPEDMDYCYGRGLCQQTIEQEQIGYAPGGKDLYRHLALLGFTDQQLLATGLFFPSSSQDLTDRYQSCLLFPYRNQGQIVYSIGRSCDPNSSPRYVKHLTHSDRYPFVSKDGIQHKMWGVDKLGVGDSLVVVEGIFDALLAQQELNDHTIISPTTNQLSKAQTEEFNQLIQRCQPKAVVFVADNEVSQAGISGARRSVEKIVESMDQDGAEVWSDRIRITSLPRPPELDKVDIADYLQAGKVDEVNYWLDAGQTLTQMQQYQDNDPLRFFRRPAGGFSPKRLADELRLEGGYYLNAGGRLCLYRNGVYQFSPRELERVCQTKLGDFTSSSRINETIRYQEIKAELERFDSKPNWINLKNGIYDFSKGQLGPHSPDNLTTIQLPVIFAPKARCDLIEQFIRQVVPPDCVDLIYQIFAYCLLPNNSYQKSFIFLGQGANGKSTLLDLLLAFLGSLNASKVSLQDLGSNRFRVAELYGRMANIFTDLDNKSLQSTSMFKMITTGDPITAERKFKDPFDFVPVCKLIFACNQLPKSHDTSPAFYRRLLIIPFPHKFEGRKADRNLLSKLTVPAQLSGLFNKVMDSLDQLREDGGFKQTESTNQALRQYQQQGNSCLWFVQTQCQVVPGDKIAKRDLYQSYQQFCQERELTTESRQQLNLAVNDCFGSSVEETRQKEEGKNVRCWNNLAVKD